MDFPGEPARDSLLAAWSLDEDTWARGRGWALWKALISLAGDPGHAAAARTVQRVLDAHRRSANPRRRP